VRHGVELHIAVLRGTDQGP